MNTYSKSFEIKKLYWEGTWIEIPGSSWMFTNGENLTLLRLRR